MPPSHTSSLQFYDFTEQFRLPEVVEAVNVGLSTTPKYLPAYLFYDERGSELFEKICNLPEYYLTRTEQQILEMHSKDIIKSAGEEIVLVELGSGSSRKTRLLIEAAIKLQKSLLYVPIDISRDFLKEAASSLLHEYQNLRIEAIAAEYNIGIKHIPESDKPRLILFLGSNLGNFDEDKALIFLQNLRNILKEDDRLLIGVDLKKDVSLLLAAYNDSSHVTEAFNKNILERINSELDANFDTSAFYHYAPYNELKSRIEMHLISKEDQSVCIGALKKIFHFKKGESIHTENSHKYSFDSFTQMARETGLKVVKNWTDPQELFALFLLDKETIL